MREEKKYTPTVWEGMSRVSGPGLWINVCGTAISHNRYHETTSAKYMQGYTLRSAAVKVRCDGN